MFFLVGVQVNNLETVTHAYVNLLLNRWHMSIHTCISLFCELKDSKRNDTPQIWKKQWCGNKHRFWFPILFPRKGTRLLGEIADYRAQRRNIEEESGGSYRTKREVKKKKKKPHSNGTMSKKTRMSFRWQKLEQNEQCNKLSKSSFGIIPQSIKQLFRKQFSEVFQDRHPR